MRFDKNFFAAKISLHYDSSVVQSVERRTVNPYVTGSSPVRGAKFKKPAFEQAFCFFASLTLTQHRIQPGKHLVDNDARYAFQTLAFPYRLPTPRVSSVSAPQLSLKKRLPVG